MLSWQRAPIPELWAPRLPSLLSFCLLSNAHPWHCFPTPALDPVLSVCSAHLWRLTESSIHCPWLSHQILFNTAPFSLSTTNSPKFSSAAWTSSGSAQLPQRSLLKPKMSQKANKLSKCKHATLSCAQSSCTDHFLQFKLPKNTATGCFHSLLLFPSHLFSVFFSSFSHQKAPVLELNLPVPLYLCLVSNTQLIFHP